MKGRTTPQARLLTSDESLAQLQKKEKKEKQVEEMEEENARKGREKDYVKKT